jgi:hypothetical protein
MDIYINIHIFYLRYSISQITEKELHIRQRIKYLNFSFVLLKRVCFLFKNRNNLLFMYLFFGCFFLIAKNLEIQLLQIKKIHISF